MVLAERALFISTEYADESTLIKNFASFFPCVQSSRPDRSYLVVPICFFGSCRLHWKISLLLRRGKKKEKRFDTRLSSADSVATIEIIHIMNFVLAEFYYQVVSKTCLRLSLFLFLFFASIQPTNGDNMINRLSPWRSSRLGYSLSMGSHGIRMEHKGVKETHWWCRLGLVSRDHQAKVKWQKKSHCSHRDNQILKRDLLRLHFFLFFHVVQLESLHNMTAVSFIIQLMM